MALTSLKGDREFRRVRQHGPYDLVFADPPYELPGAALTAVVASLLPAAFAAFRDPVRVMRTA